MSSRRYLSRRRQPLGPCAQVETLEARLLLSATPEQIAAALDLPAGVIVSYSGNAAAVTTQNLPSGTLMGLPTGGDGDFLLLSTGLADDITRLPNSGGNQGTDLGPRGVDSDLATISFTLTVPTGLVRPRLRFDFVFASEEFPEWVGSDFNDVFSARVNGQDVAFDDQANPVSVNSVFFDGSLSTAGTFFDGRTELLTATYYVPEGAAQLVVELEIGDTGDGLYDSAVLLDHVRFESAPLVYLDFGGRDVGSHFAPLTRMVVPPFAPADLHLAQDRQAVIEQIVSAVSSRFAAYDVGFVISPPATGEYETVVIGGSMQTPIELGNPVWLARAGAAVVPFDTYYNVIERGSAPGTYVIFGRAAGIDLGNQDPSDLAVVFSGEAESIDALAGSIAHELGHNLGLRHVKTTDEQGQPANLDELMRSAPRSPAAAFTDVDRPLAETWANGATTQNSCRYLMAVLGNGQSGLDLSALERGQGQRRLMVNFGRGLYDVTIGVMGGAADDGGIAPQTIHLERARGWQEIVLPDVFAEPQLFVYGASRSGGAIDIFSGELAGGLPELTLPLLENGQVRLDVPLLQQRRGQYRAAGGLKLSQPTGGGQWLAGGVGQFVDADGDHYTVRLTGPGAAAVELDDPDLDGQGGAGRIEVVGGTSRTRLVVTVERVEGGDGLVEVGAVSCGDLAVLAMPRCDLVGQGLSAGGTVRDIRIHDTLNGADIVTAAGRGSRLDAHVLGDGTSVNIGGRLARLTAAAVGRGQIAAMSLGRAVITGDPAAGISGDFLADLTLGDGSGGQVLGRLSVRDWLGGQLLLAGGAGQISAGGLRDASILVGYALGQAPEPPTSADDFALPARLGRLTVAGIAGESCSVLRSTVAAWRIASAELPDTSLAGPGGAADIRADSIARLASVGDLGPVNRRNLATPADSFQDNGLDVTIF